MTTHRGVRQLALEEYLKVVRAYEPDIIAAFADSISDLDQTEEGGRPLGPEPGQKRVRKSVDRSLRWLDQILMDRQGKPWAGVSVFAHVVGSHMEQERIRSAQETAKRQEVDGFVIDTLSLLGSKDEILRLLKVSIDHLPTEKPRVVYGMQTPEDVLRSISLGADLFDTSYPSQLTEDGKASLYSFGTSPTSPPSSLTSSNDRGTSKRWINLWDDEHADKFVPLLEGCECYACKGGRHTRAYINHLLKAHEMLATVLLMSHNVHQYSKFFASIRQSIEVGTFEEQSASFIETFGKEPEQTGVIHAAQVAVEVALSKRSRLNFNSENTAATDTAALAAEERGPQKDKMEEAKRTKEKEDLVNKKEKRLGKLQQEPQLQQQKEQEP
ncbi:tRNA-guanine(15) transglycosylase-like protein [Dissophora ornata]|nr:tRNA-guanine(15) transglycosylase-like protein [Dissophora ornata]